MKTATFLTASTLLSAANALKVVKFDLEKKTSSNLSKRDTVKAQLINQVENYALNVSIGTPPQNLTLYLDTGSSDLWVNVKTSEYCSSREDPCIGGFFDPTSSSTYHVVYPNGFNIQYGDNTTAAGDYSADTVYINGVNVTNQTFGVALNNTGNPEGLLGVGFDVNEAYCNNNGSQGLPCTSPYNNFVSNLALQGKINSRAYSLWLDTNTSNTGYLLFGGVDSAYYTGNLVALDMVPDDTLTLSDGSPYYRELQVAAVDIALNNATLIEGFTPIRALLDSGTTQSQVPKAVLDALTEQLGLTYSSEYEGYLVSCSLGMSSDTLTYTFGSTNGGAVVNVPFSELVGSPTGGKHSDGGEQCQFGLNVQQGIDQMVLGDTFLRSAYVVYDLDSHVIAMAQSNWKPGNSNVQEIPSGGVSALIPGATATISASAPVGTAGETGTAYSSAASGTATATASSSSSSSSSAATQLGSQMPSMAGLISVVVVLLGTAAGAFAL